MPTTWTTVELASCKGVTAKGRPCKLHPSVVGGTGPCYLHGGGPSNSAQIRGTALPSYAIAERARATR
jgi:hypothetical protein